MVIKMINRLIYSNSSQIVNIGLRGITLLSKFLLVFFLGKFLEPSQLGLYGLLTVTISYSLYFLGFDFYIFTTREVLKSASLQWGGLVKDQAVISFILYLFFLPLLSLIFFKNILPWSLIAWFYILLVLEHLNQELSRLLVAVSEQLSASVNLFLRQGLWALSLIFLMYNDSTYRTLHFVLVTWTVGSFLALLIGIIRLYQLGISGWLNDIDWKWIKRGLITSVPFLIATLALRALFTLDRYWFEALEGIEALGAYVLFIGLCNALMSFLDAGVFSFTYPALISTWNQKLPEGYRKILKRMIIQTGIISFGFSAVSLVAIEYLLLWLDKTIYIEKISLFPWLLSIMLLYSLGMIPHYALYSQGQDGPIIRGHLFSFAVFVFSTWILTFYSTELAVPIGLCFTFMFILIWKSIAFYRLSPMEYRLSIKKW